MIDRLPSGKWRVRLYHQSRYFASRTFALKREAKAWETRQIAMLAGGTWVHPADATMPFSEWMRIWLETKGGAPSSRATRETMVRLHILPEFGRMPLSMISATDVETFVASLRSSHSADTARQALVPLRQALRLALREGLIQRDPTIGVRLPKARPNEPRPLSHAQVWRLADAAVCERDRAMFVTMAYSGARWGEISALKRSSLTPTGLRLTEAYSEVAGRLILGDLKDHEARSVPLPSRVRSELLAWAQHSKQDELLFRTANGTAFRNGNWRRSILTPALRRADLPEDFTPHNFRDTAASLAIEAGASVVAVARMLGHEDSSTTLRHYASLFPDTFDRIADRMNMAIETVIQRESDNNGEEATDTTPTQPCR